MIVIEHLKLSELPAPWRAKLAATKNARLLDNLPELQLSAVTHMELIQGSRNRQELTLLKKDLNHRKAAILPISELVSNRAANLQFGGGAFSGRRAN